MQTEDKILLFQDLVKKSSREEISWFHGYCSALLSKDFPTHETSTNGHALAIKPTIIYGTESGNSKKVALNLQSFLKQKGVSSKIFDASQYPLQKFEKEELVFLIISTQGEGEPPASAQKFYDFLHQDGRSFPKLKYAVLALGDTSYPLFCKAGADIDNQLSKYQSTKLLELQKCDTDFEESSNQWINTLFEVLLKNPVEKKAVTNGISIEKIGYKTLTGRIIEHINLNDNQSDKETFHIAIELEEPAMYEPGDVAGIYPENQPETVKKILTLTGVDPFKEFQLGKKSGTIREHLTKNLNISYLSLEIIRKYGKIVAQEIPEVRMDLQDLLRIYPIKSALEFEEILAILYPISPRLYSIASSPNAHESEIHLTVARSPFYTSEGLEKFGICSDFLGHKIQDSEIQFFIRKNGHFRLPAPDKDIIMIGPGTGIAPFRSFVSERDAKGASGRNWLFFGDRKFTENFLYQTEWQQFASTGVLTKVNLAWSRDGVEKNYVQHEILKEAEELVEWLDAGAYIYICGAKDPMSKDVESALRTILSQNKNWTDQESEQYLEDLAAKGRFQKDDY